jgi:integrase
MNATPLRKARKERKAAHYTASFGHKRVHVYRRRTPSGNLAFMVADTSEVSEDGRVKRRFLSFSDEAVAKSTADTLAERLSKMESTAMRLTEAQAIEYVSATQDLLPFNLSVRAASAAVTECLKVLGDGLPSLHAAVKFYRARFKPTVAKPVADVVVELLKLKESRGASDRYRADLASRLNRFAGDCKKAACNVAASDVQAWLDSQKADKGKPLSPQTYKNYRTVLHTLFKFAVARGYAADNPVEGVEKLRVRSGDIEIFKPLEIARLLAAAQTTAPAFLPCLAIGAFAGLRSAELERLEWCDIDLTARHIVVAASKSKTASRRIVPLADNLAEWLRPYVGKRQGKVWPGESFQFYKRQQEVALATAVEADEAKGVKTQKPVEWKGNALRHSYASYRFAQTGDAGRVAGECGNRAAVIHRHYRELVKPADAERWFNVRPEAPANVLPMPAAVIAQ